MEHAQEIKEKWRSVEHQRMREEQIEQRGG
jgi:hypothetical protein